MLCLSFMTDKTSLFLRLDAADHHFFLLVAFGTVIHFHAIPCVFLEATYVLSPDIPAVARDSVLLIRLHIL